VDEAMPALQSAYQAPRRPDLVSTPDGYCMALCHERIGLPQETEFENMVFPHVLHAEDLGVECTTCHSPDKHKMQIVTKTECMSCHHEALDIDCAHCHPATAALYSGQTEAWEGVEGYADVMADAEVECVECHDLDGPLSRESLQTTCIDCHDDDYGATMTEWIAEIGSELDAAKAELSALQNLVDRRRGATTVVSELQTAAAMVDLIDMGRGVHNYELSLEVLAQARERLTRVRDLVAPASAAR
jgi:hypothetical protein